MTIAEKNLVEMYRSQGLSCSEIASRVNLSVNTVKSYCRRKKQSLEASFAAASAVSVPSSVSSETGICKNCGTVMTAAPGKRNKLFCSDKCRYQWWHLHRGNSLNAEERTCLFCGKIFRTNRIQKYCCHDCYIRGRFYKQHDTQPSAV